MTGGVSRYSQNLVQALERNDDIEVYVATRETCMSNRDNIFPVLMPGSRKNSDRILKLIDRLGIDIVHVQYERGLYEIDNTLRHQLARFLLGSTLDKLYEDSPVPTITTLHTVFPWQEYLEYLRVHVKRREGRFGFLPLKLRVLARTAVMKQRYKLLLDITQHSDEFVNLSKVSYELINKGRVIYHGAEPSAAVARAIPSDTEKKNLREQLGLPTDKKLLLAFGYVGSYKGFDMLENIKLPETWRLVIKQNTHERGKERPVEIPSAINLHLDQVDDTNLSKLFYACDAIIFPYRIVSISGVLFDAIAHGLPFIASDLKFFREFADLGIGVVCNRSHESFEEALKKLESNELYHQNAIKFRDNLTWGRIAEQHMRLYSKCLNFNKELPAMVIPSMQ